MCLLEGETSMTTEEFETRLTGNAYLPGEEYRTGRWAWRMVERLLTMQERVALLEYIRYQEAEGKK